MPHRLKIVEIENLSDIKSNTYPQYVKLYTTFCNPCKVLTKNLESTEFNKEMTLYSLDIEKDSQVKKKLKLMGVPAFLKIEKENEFLPENVKNFSSVEKFCQFTGMEIVEESEDLNFDESDF